MSRLQPLPGLILLSVLVVSMSTTSVMAQASAAKFVREPVGYLYLIVGNRIWNLEPMAISDADIAALDAGDELQGDAIPDSLISAVTPSNPLQVMQAGDGTLYLVQSGNIWPVTPGFIRNSELLNFTGSGTISGTIGPDVLTGGTTAPAAPDASGAISPDLSSFKAFPGPVLVPPAGLQPFASLPGESAGPAADNWSGTSCTSYTPSFGVFLSNPNLNGSLAVPIAKVEGAMSRKMYDDDAANVAKTYTGCATTAAYCARPNFPPCTGLGCPQRGEIFRGLTARGVPAFLEHLQVDGFWRWNLDWFDPQAGATYRILISGVFDPGTDPFAVFDSGLAPSNRAGAEQFAALADKLVRWTGP